MFKEVYEIDLIVSKIFKWFLFRAKVDTSKHRLIRYGIVCST